MYAALLLLLLSQSAWYTFAAEREVSEYEATSRTNCVYFSYARGGHGRGNAAKW